MGDFLAALDAAAREAEDTLGTLLRPADPAAPALWEAMRYAVLGGGKRLRPFLVLAGSDMLGAERAGAARVGAAVELVHCYSLVHDDLPAMDDDDLRRGRPTLHKATDEAMAILAGDALLTLAFEVLADPATAPDGAVRAELALDLARAAGAAGMVGGQVLDLAAESRPDLDLDDVATLQRLKTGALIGFAGRAGGILAQADAAARAALDAYARDLGLAFQIADDLLDVEGDAAEVGKAVGKDAARGKATFVSLLGVAGARAAAQDAVDRAVAALDSFGEKADFLVAAARFVIARRN